MSQSIALVAGEGSAGFLDGDFTSAVFNYPLGLAINSDGTRLFLADSNNHRIREIHLDQNNIVTTLAGFSTGGNQDGPLASASFNQPRGIVYLPGDRLVVNDFGNGLLRLVDLKTKTVTTFAGNTPSDLREGPAAQVSMAGIWSMCYIPGANSIFFSQPDLGTVKRLDLKTSQVTLAADGREGLPHPSALWGNSGTLYVADRDQLGIYASEWKSGADSNWRQVASAVTNVLALSGSGENLYALQAGDNAPLQRLLPNTEGVTFVSFWGDVIPTPGNFLPSFIHSGALDPIGIVPDPTDETKFYITNPRLNIITSYRDLFRNTANGIQEANLENRNENGVLGFLYPARKPPHTFRILLVGDSHSAWVYGLPYKPQSDVHPYQLSISKRLEQELNTLASLDDKSMNFEVLNLMRISAAPLFLWPTYEVPEVARKNDVDLVVILQVPSSCEGEYFLRPLGPDGIPSHEVDPEYMMKPPLERIPDGEPRRLYDLCKAQNLVKIEGQYVLFENLETADAKIRHSLIQLYGKPLDILQKKLESIHTSAGKPVRLLLCFTPTGFYFPRTGMADIWRDAAREFHIPFLNMNQEMTALRLSYYPISEMTGDDHFVPEGHLFFGSLLAHDLIRDRIIPWDTSSQPGK